MKSSVSYSKLSTLCKVQNGYAFDSKLFTTDSNDMPLVRIRDIKTGKTETFYKGGYSQEYVLHNGDYIIGMDGEFNITEWQGGEALLNQRVCRVFVSSDIVLPKFILYFLPIPLKKIEDETPFVTVKHLSSKKLNDVIVPVPSLEEQQRIVAELDLLTGIIDAKKAQLRDLDDLIRSVFYEMFGDPITNDKGWIVSRFGDIGTLTRGSGLSKKDLIQTGNPCILYGQIHTSFGTYTSRHISCIPDDLVGTAKVAHPGDVLMAITSEDVEGSCKSTAWLGDYDVYVGSDAAIFHHNQNGIFVSYYTQTKAFYYEKAKYAKGFKVTHISTKEIATIPILLPPIELQRSFAEIVLSVEKQKDDIKRSIADIEILFNSRLDYYFSD